MSDDDLICICMSVTRGEIKASLKSGARSLDDLKSTLFCCTGCGTCETRVRGVMAEAESGDNSAKADAAAEPALAEKAK